MAARIDEAALERGLAALEAARPFRPRVVSRLEAVLRAGSDEDLFRLDPVPFAAAHGLAEDEAIDLLLHATRAGLFELGWHLVCAFCGHVVERLADLSTLHAHYGCGFCSAQNEAVLDETIRPAFTVSRRVRAISFHEPEALPIEAYAIGYHFARGVTFANGATLAQVGAAITRHLAWVEPGERVVVETEIVSGRLAVKDLRHRASVACFLDAPRESEARVGLRLAGGRFEVEGRPVAPRTLVQRHARFEYDATLDLEAGRVRLEVTNEGETRSALWVVFLPAAFESARVGFAPFLSGKRLLTSQTFRELFRADTFDAEEGIAVRDLTFLFTDLKGSTELYERVGDVRAFFLVRQHFEALTGALAAHGGALVKTIGDAVMATFATPADAVRGAFAMREALRRWNEGASTPLSLKVGLHRGPAIAVTLNDRVDYFGQTVNVAARIQGIAGGDEVYVSASVHDDPEVAALLAGTHVQAEQVALKGVDGKVAVYRIASAEGASEAPASG